MNPIDMIADALLALAAWWTRRLEIACEAEESWRAAYVAAQKRRLEGGM